MDRTAKIGCTAAAAGILLLLVTASTIGIYFLVSFQQGQTLFWEGHSAMNREEYDNAISKFDAALQKRLTHYYRTYAYENRAYCNYQKNKPDQAIHDYTEALRLNSNLSHAYYYRGVLNEHRKERDSAFSDYSNAIRCDPNLAGALYHRGLIFMLRQDFSSAISDFSEAIRSSPGDAAAYLERGNAYARTGSLDEALASYDSAVLEAPAFTRAYLERARLYRRKHELNKTLCDLDEAIRLDPKSAAALHERDRVLREATLEGGSIEAITEVIGRNPRDEKALEARGGIYLAKHDYERAISDFTECIRLTQSRSAYDHRAETYFKAGDYAKAVADYEEGAQHSGPVTVAAKGLAWLLATCPNPAFRHGKHAVEEARDDCERTAWKNWNCMDTLAAASAEAGNFADAVKYEEQALAMKELPSESQVEFQQRLALYEARKPYRDGKK